MAFTYPLICVNVLDNEFYITMHTFLCFSLSLCPFSSGTIQGGFYTPDRESRFIMSTFRGMPCSVLEIGLFWRIWSTPPSGRGEFCLSPHYRVGEFGCPLDLCTPLHLFTERSLKSLKFGDQSEQQK